MSRDRLHRLLTLAERSDPALHAWFRDALARWEHGLAMEQALELRGGSARALRDAGIRRLAELLDSDGRHSRWHTAGLVERALARRHTTGEIGVLVEQIIRSGCSVVPKRRQIWSVLGVREEAQAAERQGVSQQTLSRDLLKNSVMTPKVGKPRRVSQRTVRRDMDKNSVMTPKVSKPRQRIIYQISRG